MHCCLAKQRVTIAKWFHRLTCGQKLIAFAVYIETPCRYHWSNGRPNLPQFNFCITNIGWLVIQLTVWIIRRRQACHSIQTSSTRKPGPTFSKGYTTKTNASSHRVIPTVQEAAFLNAKSRKAAHALVVEKFDNLLCRKKMWQSTPLPQRSRVLPRQTKETNRHWAIFCGHIFCCQKTG